MSYLATKTPTINKAGEVPVQEKQTTTTQQVRKQSGFTMIELMIVVGLLAVVATVGFNMFNSSVTNKATALQKWDLTNRLVTVMTVAGQAGAGTNVKDSPFVKDKELLNVLVGGEACVSEDFQRAYRGMGLKTYEESLSVTKRPACAGGSGTDSEYKMGNSVVTTAGTKGELEVKFTNVTSNELEAIVSEYGDDKKFTAENLEAGPDGPLSWTAASGGLHTLTITRKLN